MENTLCLKNVTMSYPFSGNAIKDINFNHNGGRLIICGDDGAGKNSLLRVIGGLENFSGQIIFNGIDLSQISSRNKNFSFTFRLDSLKKGKSVRQILNYPFEIRNIKVDNQIEQIADKFMLTDMLDTKVRKLSQKDKIRLIYARAFVRECDLYLINATYADNDEELKVILKREINSRDNVIVTTCDPYQFDGKLIMLYSGELYGYGTLEEHIKSPQILNIVKMLKLEYSQGVLIKDGDYFVEIDSERIQVDPPFSDEFIGEEVYVYNRLCYDFVSERLITKID